MGVGKWIKKVGVGDEEGCDNPKNEKSDLSCKDSRKV